MFPNRGIMVVTTIRTLALAAHHYSVFRQVVAGRILVLVVQTFSAPSAKNIQDERHSI
jgi:hypothetical protein